MPSRPITIDAPVGGWDAFHAIDEMPPNMAVILDNLIPKAGSVDTRKGTLEYIDLETGVPVETVASFNSVDDQQIVAASDGGIFDITDASSPVTVAATSTYTNDRWQYANFRKVSETGVLLLMNGADDTQVYDGSTLTALDTTGTVGLTAPEFLGGLSFKGRMFYFLPNDDAFWYAAAGSYQGQLTEFPLGAFVRKGGYIVAMLAWTMQDAGVGMDDQMAIVFSTGEILIYRGDDPGTTDAWTLVGKYYTAEPLGPRGFANYGSDVILMTKDGYVSLSSVIQEGRTSDVPQFSRIISRAIKERTASTASLFGWECNLFQKEGLFIFNAPLSEETYEQHVLNTVTGAWCRFIDLNFNCFTVHDERLYAGTNDGRVFTVLEGVSDNGMAITFNALPAYLTMDDFGVQKHLQAAQIISTHSQPSLINIQAYADYEVPTLNPITLPTAVGIAAWSINPPSPASPVGSYWDTDYWDLGDLTRSTKGWQDVSAYGYAVTILVRFAKVNEGVKWRATGLRYALGGAH